MITAGTMHVSVKSIEARERFLLLLFFLFFGEELKQDASAQGPAVS